MTRISLCGAALFAALSFAAVAQAQPQPQVIGLPVSQPGDVLPPDFRGTVRYFGNHSGEVAVLRSTGDQPRKRNTDCPRPDEGCPDPIGGSLEIVLEFDGDVVHGEFRGTGGLRDSQLIGRRQGAECRLFDVTDGSVWAGRCDEQAFIGSAQSVANAPIQVRLAFETVGTRTVDYAERERRRREAILRRRRIEALTAQIDSNAPIEERFAAAIELDSYAWQYDAIQPGSIGGIDRGREKNDRFQIYGEFALKSGGTGWARATVDHGNIACIEFWDVPGVCRAVRRPPPPPMPEDEPEAGAFLLPARPADSAPAA